MLLHKIVSGVVSCTALLNCVDLGIPQMSSCVRSLFYPSVLHNTVPITSLQLLFKQFDSNLDKFDIDISGCERSGSALRPSFSYEISTFVFGMWMFIILTHCITKEACSCLCGTENKPNESKFYNTGTAVFKVCLFTFV